MTMGRWRNFESRHIGSSGGSIECPLLRRRRRSNRRRCNRTLIGQQSWTTWYAICRSVGTRNPDAVNLDPAFDGPDTKRNVIAFLATAHAWSVLESFLFLSGSSCLGQSGVFAKLPLVKKELDDTGKDDKDLYRISPDVLWVQLFHSTSRHTMATPMT